MCPGKFCGGVKAGPIVIVFACGFVVAALVATHAYRCAHTGFVLWARGPGVEVTGDRGILMEECR